jgi:hypothetical protein
MKDTFVFCEHAIGLKVFAGVPHFCALDISKVCGYKAGLPFRPEDKPIRSGAHNYISLHDVGMILGRTTGHRRSIAQDLLASIERAFALAMPVAQPVISAAPIASDYDMRIKRNQLEIEIDELMAEQADKQSAIYKMSRSLKETKARIYERERELAALKDSSISLLRLPEKVISNG